MRWIVTGLVAAALATPALADAPILGTYPRYYRETSEVWFETHLKDPYSAHVRLLRGPAWAELPVTWGIKKRGWAVCFRVNAKNAQGGYSGPQTWVLFLNGKTVTDAANDDAPEDSRAWVQAGAIDAECAKPAPALMTGIDLTPGPLPLSPD